MTIPNNQNLYSVSSANTSSGVFLTIFEPRSPSYLDTNYPVKQRWLNTIDYSDWILVGFTSTSGYISANWVHLNGQSVGGITWQTITASTALQSNNGYVCFAGSPLSLSLPTTSSVGDIIEITTRTANGFVITQNAGQEISEGILSTTFGAAGTVTSLRINDSLRMVCVQANASWTVLSSTGNFIYT